MSAAPTAPASCCSSFFKSLIRKKKVDSQSTETELSRCLSTIDLTFLGIGSTLGLGIYVIAGQVAIDKSGPSVVISFLIAAVVSLFAGLCYAEFGARVPRAGSAYVYSYVTVGEFMAFVIGWNLVMEYIIGTASVARGYSTYIDSLLNHAIERYFNRTMPINIPNMSSFPDFLSFGITLGLTLLMALGVKNSTRLNNVLTCLNLFVVVYIIICGAFKVDFHNWNLSTDEVPAGQAGGFFPFGINGMMEGAATCFYCFVGFDCIATTGEEVRNPQRAIPISITISLAAVCLAYLGVSGIETLMAPYWMPDYSAPLPWVFFHVGYRVGAYIIIAGAIFGLSTSLLGGMFPLPRILYAMASDKLIYAPLSKVSSRFQTPLLATVIAGIFTGIMAMLFNTKELANMMSIGTLLAYTLVALSILILRYQMDQLEETTEGNQLHEYGSVLGLSSVNFYSTSDAFKQVFNMGGFTTPTSLSSSLSKIFLTVLIFLFIGINGIVVYGNTELAAVDPVFIGFLSLLILLSVGTIIALARQPCAPVKLNFKVWGVPFIPLISIFCNIHLMMRLDTMTWIRFAIWMLLGFFIYFTYGIRKSVIRNPPLSSKVEELPIEEPPIPVVVKTEQSRLIR